MVDNDVNYTNSGQYSNTNCFLPSNRILENAGWRYVDTDLYSKTFIVTDRSDQSYIIGTSHLGLKSVDDPVLLALMGEADGDQITDTYGGMCIIGSYTTAIVSKYGAVVCPCPPDADSAQINALGQRFADDLFRWESIRSNSNDPMSLPVNGRDAATKRELLTNLARIGRNQGITSQCGNESEDFTNAISLGQINLAKLIANSKPVNPLVVQAAYILVEGVTTSPLDIDAFDRWKAFTGEHNLFPNQLDDINAGLIAMECACGLTMYYRYDIADARNLLNDALNYFSTPTGSQLTGLCYAALPSLLWISDYPGFRAMVRESQVNN